MLLSELPTDDPRCFGGVVLGDVEDDGAECEGTLATLMAAWREHGWPRAHRHLVASDPHWREVWGDAIDGWADLQRLRPALLALAIAEEATRAELRHVQRLMAEAERIRAELDVARAVSVDAMRLLEEVLGA